MKARWCTAHAAASPRELTIAKQLQSGVSRSEATDHACGGAVWGPKKTCVLTLVTPMQMKTRRVLASSQPRHPRQGGLRAA
mmetsp:Transcript_17155/g.51327  ORF Transcript_17155/g.51327 Transcript_17155/m.51327 type:complete len:81 (-) Transcript_17155:2241-2483(-)